MKGGWQKRYNVSNPQIQFVTMTTRSTFANLDITVPKYIIIKIPFRLEFFGLVSLIGSHKGDVPRQIIKS